MASRTRHGRLDQGNPVTLRLDVDKVFKALADPGRRHLLDLLHEENEHEEEPLRYAFMAFTAAMSPCV